MKSKNIWAFWKQTPQKNAIALLLTQLRSQSTAADGRRAYASFDVDSGMLNSMQKRYRIHKEVGSGEVVHITV